MKNLINLKHKIKNYFTRLFVFEITYRQDFLIDLAIFLSTGKNNNSETSLIRGRRDSKIRTPN